MSEEKKKEKSFVFVDKRKSHEAQNQADPNKKAPEETTTPEDLENKPGKAQALPEIDFNFFVLSLSSSAMIQLGVIPNPLTQKKERNLNGAKQTIDIIALLEKKTQGNLTPEEAQLIESVLYDLRIKFVEESKNR